MEEEKQPKTIIAAPAKKRPKNNDGLVMGKIHYYYSHKIATPLHALGIAIMWGGGFFRIITNE